MGVLNEILDTALAWYYITLQEYGRIPKSIVNMGQSNGAAPKYGRLLIIYANYLIGTGEYAKLVAMLEHLRGVTVSKGVYADGISISVTLAIAYLHRGEADKAVKALHDAYEMTYNNGLITPFIEGGGHMRALIEAARGQGRYGFAPGWLEQIDGQAAAFEKRSAAVRAVYNKQKLPLPAGDNPLTRREREVLQALSQGLTREEIAARQFVSVNTVKSIIRSIFNRLDVNSRTEAVSIAIARGYIDGYSAR